jgi:uncharacterized membrane protein
MAWMTSPLYVAAVLLLLVVFSEWLGQKKYFSYLGSVLIVIIAAAILANINVLPSANSTPLYDAIGKYAAPIGLFFLLLDVKLKDLRYAGLPMISMFLLGSAATIVGTLVSYYIIEPQHNNIDQSYAVAGMFTGTYIGGSINLNAIALHYGVTKNGNMFAAINAADNIATALWTILVIFLPPFLQKRFPRKMKAVRVDPSKELAALEHQKESISVPSLAMLLALGIGSLFISDLIHDQLKDIPNLKEIPTILILTTFALVLAQIPAVQKLQGAKTLGFFLVLLFLAVVGTLCDVNALAQTGQVAITLFIWIAILILIHGIILFVVGTLFKQDWYVLSLTSIANIGGPASAAAVATSFGRSDLRLPSIIVGSIGYAIGTYLGILVAEFLK